MLWFEFGGNKIGRLYVEGPEAEEFPKWRLIAKFKGEFPCHFTLVYINGGAVGDPNIAKHKDIGSWFLHGSVGLWIELCTGRRQPALPAARPVHGAGGSPPCPPPAPCNMI